MIDLAEFKLAFQGKTNQWLLRISILACLVGLLSFLIVPKQLQSQENKDEKVISLLRLGKVISPVTFINTKGEKWQLHDQKDAKAIVVTFLDFKCPISNRYITVLNSLTEKYKDKGVIFTGVICDSESPAELDKHTKEFLANFKVFYDPNHIVSNHFLADVTPECFLLDQDKKLMYFGAIDDQYQDRTTRLKNTKNAYLAEAIDQVLSNKPVEVKTTQAIGCPLSRKRKNPVQREKSLFTKMYFPYYKNIASVVIARAK
ncbi:MAG: hypothetical protein EBQ87_15670 [Planctomycetes bacterium]|nr:hypothetical protein [Planctomycetota bacterium]